MMREEYQKKIKPPPFVQCTRLGKGCDFVAQLEMNSTEPGMHCPVCIDRRDSFLVRASWAQRDRSALPIRETRR